MYVFITEKSLNGLLSAVFYSYVNKIKPQVVTNTTLQLGFYTKIIEITPNEINYKRVLTALIKYTDNSIVSDLNLALRNANIDTLTICFNYVCKILDHKQSVSFMLSDVDVINFNDLCHQVTNEAHRYKGFLRFIETSNGVLYGFYEPENNITSLITPHFARRLAKLPFIIHDIKRGVIALHHQNVTKYIQNDSKLYIELSNQEEEINSLWQKYFNTVSIPERANYNLQRAFLPKKMRKHMLEFKPNNK